MIAEESLRSKGMNGSNIKLIQQFSYFHVALIKYHGQKKLKEERLLRHMVLEK